MRYGSMFWGMVIILLGVLLLMQSAGLIYDLFGWFWPLALILLGLWMLLGRFLPLHPADDEPFEIGLQGAKRLELEINQGAGSLSLGGGAPAGLALHGNMAPGLEQSSSLNGEALMVSIKAGPTIFPFLGPESGAWRFALAGDVPLRLKLDLGASTLDCDLSSVQLSFLGINAGASSIRVQLPQGEGYSLVDIQSGAASIDLQIPPETAARIRLEQGASGIHLDEGRFLRCVGMTDVFQSADYEENRRQVEIHLEGGANSVLVH